MQSSQVKTKAKTNAGKKRNSKTFNQGKLKPRLINLWLEAQ